jgi:hypothetical protein
MIIKRVPNFLLNGIASSNYWGDGSDGALNTASSLNFTTVQDGDAYVANLTDLTINYGHTMSVLNRNKGLFVYCQGNANIAGTLSMTGKGAYADPVSAGVSSTGLRLVRLKTGGSEILSASDVNGFGSDLIAAEAYQQGISGNGSIYTIARTGGAGGAQVYGPNAGLASGNPGGVIANGCGGGGSGCGADKCYSGYGTAGTCFGGGAAGSGSTSRSAQGNASLYCGPGGNCPAVWDNNCGGGGGAGNPGGIGRSGKSSFTCYDGETGVGGVIVLFVAGNLTIASTGIIEAKGMKGGNANAQYYASAGGSSGGGRIIILYAGTYSNNGTISVQGGTSAVSYSNNKTSYGGAGGLGKITIDQIDL